MSTAAPSRRRQARRIQMLVLVVMAVFAILALRAVWLGGIRSSSLSAKADRQHFQPITMPATRGTIISADKQVLAVDVPAIEITADARYVRDPVTTADTILSAIGGDASRRERLIRDLSSRRPYVPVARAVRMKEGEYLRQLNLDGIHFRRTSRRSYPMSTVAGQVVGYTKLDTREGIEGVEATRNDVLTGTDGRRVEVREPKLGQTVRIQDLVQPEPGRQVELTINAAIQRRLEEILVAARLEYDAKGATGVVMNPNTGALIAVATVPRLNPNDRANLDPAETQVRPITDPYEPGSVFKVVTIAGALEDGVTTPTRRYNLPPFIEIPADPKPFKIGEAHERYGWKTMTTTEILRTSSNIGTIRISRELRKRNRLRYWMDRFGFGHSTGVDLRNESSGLLPKLGWNQGQAANIPIGQGLTATMLQQVRAYAAIANGGELVTPYLVERIDGRAAERPAPTRILTRQTATELTAIMEEVVEGSDGTGVQAALKNYRVAGKTGTAQKVDPAKGVYVDRFRSSFIGFVPASKPELVIAVMLDDPDPVGPHTGGEVAAPAFREIADYALSSLNIPPG